MIRFPEGIPYMSINSSIAPKNCQLHPGYLKDPCLGQFCFFCLWMIYQILLRHRELPVMMILRFSRASIQSQTVMPCNQILTILSVGPNHLGSYLISPSVNTSVSPAKNHLYSPSTTSTKRLWNLVIQGKTLACGCQAILIASRGSVLLSRGWLVTVEAPEHPQHPPSTQLDAFVKHLKNPVFSIRTVIFSTLFPLPQFMALMLHTQAINWSGRS